jgi:hypothetical protein
LNRDCALTLDLESMLPWRPAKSFFDSIDPKPISH